jgi:glycine/D-amino acid oxidase-like deaminating enzyme
VASSVTATPEAPKTGAQGVRRHSLWLEQALGRERAMPTPAAEGRLTADICIVGGGYTGLWTAIRILEADPGASVFVLEGDLCGAGASGRNGGFALTWWPKIETLIERTGEEDAFRLARLSEQALDELEAFCLRERIEAQFRRGGWLWTATSPAQREAWAGAVELCARRDEHPFLPVSPEELRERTGSPAHYGGVFERSAATVHPAQLVRGLRRVALERGARIFERSPVRALDRDRGELRTPGGSVRAHTVVLATNAWAAQVRELRRAIVPLSSDVVATAPMAERLATSGWTGGESISDSRLMVRYYRTTEDGRVVFGRGGGALGFAGRFGERFRLRRRAGAHGASRPVRAGAGGERNPDHPRLGRRGRP